MAIVTLVVMEPGSSWPGQVGASENLVVRHDGKGLLRSTRMRLDSLRRQGHRVRVAVLACSEATDSGSVARRTEVAHDLLDAVACMPGGRLVLSSVDGASDEVRHGLFLLAGTLSCKLPGSGAMVLARFNTTGDGREVPAARVRPRPGSRAVAVEGS